MKLSKMHESQLASHDELTAVCGSNPRPSSYLAPYTIPNSTRSNPTEQHSTCNLLCYASTFTLYVGSLQARWIDTDDHMYIENLAIGDKQCPPLCQCFGGGYTPFCHPPFEISLLITLKPHAGHTKFLDFYAFILDKNLFVRSWRRTRIIRTPTYAYVLV